MVSKFLKKGTTFKDFYFITDKRNERTTLCRTAESPQIKKYFKVKCKNPSHQKLGLLPKRCSATPGFRWFFSICRVPLLYFEGFLQTSVANYWIYKLRWYSHPHSI